MRRFRGRSRSGVRRGQRRRLTWQRFFVANNGLSGPLGTITGEAWWVRPPAGRCSVGCDADVKVEEDWTHVRTLWDVKMNIQYAFAAGLETNWLVAAGILVWEGLDDTNPSFADVPDPGTEADFDWVIWSGGWIPNRGLGTSVVNLQVNFDGLDTRAETRAQRKLSAGQGLLFVISFNNAIGNNAAIWSYGAITRNLYKLP